MPDFGIAAQVKPPEINPLQLASGIAQTQNQLNQNRLFSQEFKARQAIGPLYQQAIDPATGRLDANKLLASAAANPDTAFMAGDLAQAAQARQAQQLGIDKSTLELQHARMSTVSDALFPLARDAATGKPVADEDLMGAVGSLIQNPLFQTPEMVQGLVAEAAKVKALPPEQRGQAIINYYLQAHANTEGLNAALGTPSAVDTGGNVTLTRQGGIQGPQATGTLPKTLAPQLSTVDTGPQVVQTEVGPNGSKPLMAFNKGMSPGEAATPVPVFSPATNTPTIITKGQFAAGAAGSGGLPAGPALGASEAAGVTGQESAKQGIGLQQRADLAPQNKALLGNLEGALTNFTSGPGADWKRVAATFVNTNSPVGPIFNPKTIASQEEFTKQALQLAQSQFQALGGTGTDSKLESTMHTSPNTALSNLGNKGIIQLLKGNEDAISAKNQAWQTWLKAGHGSESYGQFSTQFNKLYDPRVFQTQYMSPAERQDMLKGMNPQEKTSFETAWKFAHRAGWIH